MAHTPAALYGYLLLLFAQMQSFFEMVKTSVVNQTLAWLCNQTKSATAEAVPRHSLMFDNIPPYFMYWALGRKFFSRRPA
eukprot:1560210-Rhodomonas_salina.1